MKNTRFLFFVLIMATLLLGACGGTAATATVGGGRVEPMLVAFIGTVDSIAGDQWVINGQTVTVPADVIQEGPFGVGDQVKVEGSVNADGSFRVSRVELPTPQDFSSLPPFSSDNSNTNDTNTNDSGINSNDDNGNTANSNDGNINDDNGNGANTNDDNGNGANTNDDNDNDSNSNDENGSNDNADDDDSNSSGGNDNGDDDRNDNDDDDDNGNDD